MSQLLDEITNNLLALVLLVAMAFWGIGCFLMAENERKRRRNEYEGRKQ